MNRQDYNFKICYILEDLFRKYPRMTIGEALYQYCMIPNRDFFNTDSSEIYKYLMDDDAIFKEPLQNEETYNNYSMDWLSKLYKIFEMYEDLRFGQAILCSYIPPGFNQVDLCYSDNCESLLRLCQNREWIEK